MCIRDRAKGDDTEAIKKATQTLTEASQTIGKIIYEEAAKQAATAGAAPGPEAAAATGDTADEPPKADDVIDADFEVKESK